MSWHYSGIIDFICCIKWPKYTDRLSVYSGRMYWPTKVVKVADLSGGRLNQIDVRDSFSVTMEETLPIGVFIAKNMFT